MSIIDKLLTKYIDKLNSGQNIEVNKFLEECPPKDRAELKELIEMIQIFNRNANHVEVNPNKVESLFNELQGIVQNASKDKHNDKLVANFRCKSIDKKNPNDLEKKLTKIFEDEFGEGE